MKPRLLVIELHHLGDAVLAMPFLRAARECYEIRVLCRAGVAEMLREFMPEVGVVEALPGWRRRFRQAAQELRAWQPQISVCAWPDTRAHLVARLTGAPQRIGFPTSERNYYARHLKWRRRRMALGQTLERVAELARWPLLTHPVNREEEQEHHLENWRRLGAELELIPQLATPWFSPPSVALPGEVEDFFGEHEDRPLWVLHAGGRLATKRWPLERYQQILKKYFAPRGLPVLIVEAPGEEAPEPADVLQKKWKTRTHGELASIIQRADCLLCNDSYASHVGAALGKKVFAIFGSGNPQWFAPFGNSGRVIQEDVCPVHPCIDRCMMPDYVCLKAVSWQKVTGSLQ